MSSTAFTDVLGPRARRRVRMTSAVSALVLAALAVVALQRLAAQGQLQAQLYTDLLQGPVFTRLAEGLLTTLRLAGVSMVYALVLGGLLALGRVSRNTAVRLLVGAYVQFFRAMPVLLLILFSYFGLRQAGLNFSTFTFIVLGLTAYNSAVLAEIFKAGILSLDRGQREAALAVGMRHWQMMSLVVVPQAVRRMLPAIVSQLVTLLKDTSLAYIIGFTEMLRTGQRIAEFLDNRLQTLGLVALIYIVINYGLNRFAVWLERRQARRYGGAIEVEGGPEDLTLTEAETQPA
ncbi:MAG: amino acid ABC transporter permease [Euzebyales bacterium]|nr:amino acid ABC transporter permease [Euzebyales bacterium]MBA3622227.1 amino acid ABC transporter permease [Euzebyales bacterium]